LTSTILHDYKGAFFAFVSLSFFHVILYIPFSSKRSLAPFPPLHCIFLLIIFKNPDATMGKSEEIFGRYFLRRAKTIKARVKESKIASDNNSRAEITFFKE